MIVVFTAISLGLSEWGWRNKPSASFYLAPTRAWELLAGSITAFVVHKRGVQPNNTLSMLGLAAIIFSLFAYDEKTPFPSVYALVPVIGAVLLVLFASKETFAAKLLSTKLFVGVGLISYSAYLWHQPLFAFARIRLNEPPSQILMLALSFLAIILAYGSWRFIETPFRNRKIVSNFKLIGTIAFTFCLIMSVGLLGHKTDGFREYKMRGYEGIVLEGDVGHFEYFKHLHEAHVDCLPKSIADRAGREGGFLRCKQTKTGESDWVLLGDSHAEHLFLGLAESNPDKNIVYYTTGGVPYLNGKSVFFKHVYQELAKPNSPKKKILLTMYFLSRVHDAEFYFNFSKAVQYLKELGHEVVILGDVPIYDKGPEVCVVAFKAGQNKQLCSIQKAEFDRQREIFEPTLQRISVENNVAYISLHSPLCNKVKCSMVRGETILYRDEHHLNILGSRLIGAYISAKLK